MNDFSHKIYIKNLKVYSRLGVFDEEKKINRAFLVSAEIYLNSKDINDDINKTVNYIKICEKITEIMNEKKFNLLETCADFISESLLIEFEEIKKIELIIKKSGLFLPSNLSYVSISVKKAWHIVFVGLGSNIGNRQKNIELALKLMQIPGLKLIKSSKIYETSPMGEVEQNDFLNCVVKIKTVLNPFELINFFLNIEISLKRERKIHWGPRTIDLDILFYDNIILSEEQIIIPHPRLQERLFVLEPMCDIEPYFLHPILNKKIIELKNILYQRRLKS